MPAQIDKHRRGYVVAAALFALVAVVRVLLSYSHTAQAFDEPTHVGAAIEWLDKGTYTLDPVHPPLSRIAIGLPLYVARERFPNLPLPDSNNASAVGVAILSGSGHYLRNLMLARIGVLPFLLLGCLVVFLWARREYGEFAAVAAVGLFTTLPIIQAFSGLAYTDIVAASTQVAAFWTFATWLDEKNNRTTTWMGIATGFALLAKATTCIFLPAAALSMWLLKWAVTRREPRTEPQSCKNLAKQVALVAVIAIALVWAGYGFSAGHVRETMQLSAESMPSFQHFPAPLGKIGRNLILADPIVPAPALIRGLATAWVLNKSQPPAYLFGHIKPGGWWYFFLVAIGVKTPIPFLLLVVAGLFPFRQLAKDGRWTAMAPAACALAILVVTMPVKYNVGTRHVLVVFPLLAIVGGYGCAYLWRLPGQQRPWGRAALAALLIWQGISTARASSDYIAYFNELAGKDPSTVLVQGCDLDCGQDLFALSRELQLRHVSHATLALWTSSNMSQMGLPEFDVPEPYKPVTGWFAISQRALRVGDLFHTTYPPDAFAWLDHYHPQEKVGKTILLYYIPGQAPALLK